MFCVLYAKFRLCITYIYINIHIFIYIHIRIYIHIHMYNIYTYIYIDIYIFIIFKFIYSIPSSLYYLLCFLQSVCNQQVYIWSVGNQLEFYLTAQRPNKKYTVIFHLNFSNVLYDFFSGEWFWSRLGVSRNSKSMRRLTLDDTLIIFFNHFPWSWW